MGAIVFLILTLTLRAVRALAWSRSDLILENLALRQQLAALTVSTRRRAVRSVDRFFWMALRNSWPRWADALAIVKPETVVAWHRRAFRGYWRWRSRPLGRPRVRRELRNLIRRIAADNPTWGAPHIHAELLKLGFDVADRTVSRYLPRRGRPSGTRQHWKTFLHNHRDVLAAMDFFTVPTATFRVLYVWFVLHHDRRRVLHLNVTDHPTAGWVCQQLRNAFPYDTAPRFLLLDRDAIFCPRVRDTLTAMGVTPKRTSYRSPWQNGATERWVGTCRRELLDHVIVLGENHLRRLLREFTYYHTDRCHLSLHKDTPSRRPIQHRPARDAKVIALPRLGGLYHRYEWREAA
jgi:putative transposase